MYFLKENIKYLRKSNRLTQPQLGDEIGVSRDNVASYERGTVPPVEVIHKIVKYFHVNFEDLIEKNLSIEGSAQVSDLDREQVQKNSQSKEASFVENGESIDRVSLKALEKVIEAQEHTIKSQQETIEALKKLIERK